MSDPSPELCTPFPSVSQHPSPIALKPSPDLGGQAPAAPAAPSDPDVSTLDPPDILPANIDPERVANLARGGAADRDIAAYFGITRRQLKTHFAPALRRGRSCLRISLQKRQLKLVTGDKPDVRMLIWLGRQYVGQSEKAAAPVSPRDQHPVGKLYRGIDFDRV